MTKMTTRMRVMDELKSWVMNDANEHTISNGTDEAFKQFVAAGLEIIEKAHAHGIDFDHRPYGGTMMMENLTNIPEIVVGPEHPAGIRSLAELRLL